MATLIQSKQIEGVVTASVVEGQFTVSGSVLATDIVASSISSSGPIYGVRYDDIQGTPNFIGGSGILITQVGDNITITNTGGGGGISGSVELISSVAQLNAYTGSNDIIIVGLQSQINSLISQTGSYETKGRGIISGSSQLYDDLDARYALSGSVRSTSGTTDFTQLTNLPSGLISSSEQILGGSGILSGSHTDISSLNTYTSSIDGRISSLESATASLQSQIDGIVHTSIPSGTISSSQQIADLGFVTSSGTSGPHTDISALNAYTASNDLSITELQTQIDTLSAATSSYLTSETDSQLLSIVGDQLSISNGNTITIPTGSSGTTDFTQLINVPSGLVSGSEQVLGGSGVLSGSITIDYNSLTNIPSGIVSSSDQVLGGTGILSGSHTDISSLNNFTSSIQTQVDGLSSQTSSYLTSAPAGTISGSQQIQDLGFVTSSLEAPFNGNRVVSNTLLGDLYSQSFNAGTTGSLAEFISQVFFPTSAPTATFTNESNSWNTNLATNGTNLVSVELTDTVDNSPYTLTLSGTDASSLTAVPTNAASSSWEIRANGDLSAATYIYDVTVGDSTDAFRTYSGRGIVIAQASSGTMSTNGTFYIIESATNGVITLSTSGRPGSTAGVSVSYSPNYGTQVATNFTSSNPLITINSTSGLLSVGSPISGSGNVSGDTITSTISWEDQYGNTDSDTISVNVTTNNAPNVSSIVTSNNNTNQATGSAEIVRITITDTEGDSLPNDGLVWTSYNNTYFSASVSSPYMYLYANNTTIPPGNYSFAYSLRDIHGFNTRYGSSSVTIAQAGVGTLGGDTTSYIIESALSGSVLRDVTGYNAGNPSQLVVSYSSNYGSQTPQSFTSSNPAIVVDNSGYLTLAVDLSGSLTQSGDTILTDITYTDQYGNVGSGSINVNVFANNAPTITFVSSSNYTDTTAISGSTAGTISISDTESNTPFQVSLSGTDGDKFNIVGNSSPYTIEPTGSLSVGTYTINITATDDYGKTTTLTNKSVVVNSSSNFGKVYVYDLGQYNSNVLQDLGVASLDGSTPPQATSYSGFGFLEKIEDGSLGDSSILYNWGTNKTATLLASGTGNNLDSILQGFGPISKANSNRFVIIFPEDTDMTGIPSSMTNSYGGSTSGEYVLEVAVDGGAFGAGLGTIEDSSVYGITLGSAVDGTTNYRVIVENNQVASATSIELAVVPSSGSTPS